MTATDAPQRRRWWIVGSIVVVVVVAGASFAVVWAGRGARPATVESARRRLRASTTVAPEPARPLVPAAGVYLYEGSGTDSLDTPPRTQQQGPTMPATVTHGEDGCWEFRIDYSSNHWQTWDYCSRGGDLHEEGGTTYQLWDFVVITHESTSTFECDAAVTVRSGQQPGDSWTQTCHDEAASDAESTGPYRYVGPETLRIGGARVPALHYLRERTMSGSQVGTERSDVWFHPDTGLPLRNVRLIEVRTATPIGDVTYTEDAFFQATSVEPSS